MVMQLGKGQVVYLVWLALHKDIGGLDERDLTRAKVY